MGGDNNNDAKRQRVDDASTQRSAFEEDMGRIRSAMNGTGSQPAPDGEALQQQSTSQQQQQEPSGGSTATANSQQQTSRPPENSQRSTAYGSEDDDEDEEGGNWLKNFRPHHARVGSDYQVSNLPAPPRAETDAASTSCVSSGSGGG